MHISVVPNVEFCDFARNMCVCVFVCEPFAMYVKRFFFFSSSFGLCRILKKAPLNWLYIISTSTFSLQEKSQTLPAWLNGLKMSWKRSQSSIWWTKIRKERELTYQIAWKVLFIISLRDGNLSIEHGQFVYGMFCVILSDVHVIFPIFVIFRLFLLESFYVGSE